MKGLTKEDNLMLRQADELIETKFLNKTSKKKEIKIWTGRMDNGLGMVTLLPSEP